MKTLVPILSLTLLTGLALAAAPSRAQAPSNDEYAGAVEIGGLDYTSNPQDISQATGAPSDPFLEGAYPTVWYRFTPNADVLVDFDTSESIGTNAVAVFTDPPSTDTFVAAPSGDPSFLQVSLTGGTTYAIMVFAVDTPDTLVLKASVGVAGPPANDEYDGATFFSGLPHTINQDISLATGNASDPFVQGQNATVWYIFNAPQDGIFDFDTSASSGRVAIYVFTNPPGENVLIASSPPGDPSLLETPLVGGWTYVVMAVALDPPGQLVLDFSLAPPPVNDEVSGALEIDALPYTKTQSIMTATGAASDPFLQGANPTVWYRFTPSEDVLVDFDTSESIGTAAIAVFEDPPSEGSLVAVASNDPSFLQASLTAGTTYDIMIIAVDTPGTLVLKASVGAAGPPANDEYEGAAFFGGLPRTVSQDISLATGNASDPFVQGQNATVWYWFNAPEDGVFDFDTSASSGRVAIYLFTNPPSEGGLIAASSSVDPSHLITPLVGGWTYVIMAVALDPPGQLVIDASRVVLPANDELAGAIVIDPLPFTDTRSVVRATGAESDPFAQGQYPTVWYRITPTEDLTVRFDASASSGTTTIAVFADPPSEGSFVAGTTEDEPPVLDVDLEAGTTYDIMIAAVGTPGQLVLTVTDRTPRGEPIDVYVGPEDAPELAEIIADEDPLRPLRIICRPGDYLLEQPLAIARRYVTFVAADPSAHPRFLGPSEEDATLFTANGMRNIAFTQIDMENAKTAIAFQRVRGFAVDDCAISTYGPSIDFEKGKDASVTNSRLTSKTAPPVLIVETLGIEVIGNQVQAGGTDTLPSPDLPLGAGVAGMILVGIEAAPEPTKDFDPGTMVVQDNRILCLGAISLGILTVTGGGPVSVEDNDIIASVGIVAPVLNFGRLLGHEPTRAVIARNTILGLAVGIVGISVLGHLDIAENSITVLGQPLSLQQEGIEASSAGIVAVGAFGTVDATDNDVTFLNSVAAVPSFGIWQIAVSSQEVMGDLPSDDSGLAHIAGNRVIGAGVGIRTDNAFEAAAEIVDNDVWLGLFGQIGIQSFRAGGRDLTAEHTATPASDYTPSPTTIANNSIHALEPTTLLGQPIGIEAYSVTKGSDPEPLVVESNEIIGAYVTAINAYGTPSVVRGNRIGGSFVEGINTLDFPGGGLPDDPNGIGFLLGPAGTVASSFWDEFPAASSSVRDNTLLLVVPRIDVTPILTEPGADVQGNTFGYGLPRPWSP